MVPYITNLCLKRSYGASHLVVIHNLFKVSINKLRDLQSALFKLTMLGFCLVKV